MNAPRDLGPDFRSWLRDVPPTPDDLPARALEQTRRTRQRRRWLWFLPGPKPTAGATTEPDRAMASEPNTRAGGRLPAATGGTRTMISATKMVGLAAVVALVGGVLAVSGTLDVQQDPVPAATIEERLELTGVQGTLEGLGDQENGMCEFRGGLADCRGDVSVERYDWDDDRLDGYMVVRTNKYSLSNAAIASTTHSFYLENEGGSWAGSGYGYTAPDDDTGHIRATLEGAGDYEGLTAILNLDMVMDMSTLVRSWAGTGVIVGPGLPDMPEPATQELLHQYHE